MCWPHTLTHEHTPNLKGKANTKCLFSGMTGFETYWHWCEAWNHFKTAVTLCFLGKEIIHIRFWCIYSSFFNFTSWVYIMYFKLFYLWTVVFIFTSFLPDSFWLLNFLLTHRCKIFNVCIHFILPRTVFYCCSHLQFVVNSNKFIGWLLVSFVVPSLFKCAHKQKSVVYMWYHLTQPVQQLQYNLCATTPVMH